jgi:hypothetical protein
MNGSFNTSSSQKQEIAGKNTKNPANLGNCEKKTQKIRQILEIVIKKLK